MPESNAPTTERFRTGSKAEETTNPPISSTSISSHLTASSTSSITFCCIRVLTPSSRRWWVATFRDNVAHNDDYPTTARYSGLIFVQKTHFESLKNRKQSRVEKRWERTRRKKKKLYPIY